MSLKFYKPLTPSNRFKKTLDKFFLFAFRFKHIHIVKKKPNYAGRNNRGIITSRHIGGGNRVLYRYIQNPIHFITGLSFYVLRTEYNPARSSYLSLMYCSEGWYCFAFKFKGVRSGDLISSSRDSLGVTRMLKAFKKEELLSNILVSGRNNSVLARSAGTSCYLLGHGNKNGLSVLKVPSGLKILVDASTTIATRGVLANADHIKQVFGKAGKSRHLNKRPIVRGLAMNPIDHPHGGGSGKGRHPVSPWCKLTKGKKTVRFRRTRLTLNVF